MVGDVFIKDELFKRFRSDGLSISTSTDPATYDKSIGGAVLHPSINAFQLIEIASLNNRVFQALGSPTVVAYMERLKIKLQEGDGYSVTVDQLDIYQENIASVCYRIMDEQIHLTSYWYMHLWHRVKGASIGED